MRIDALATEPQYLDALAPVWNALPASVKGEFITDDFLLPRAKGYGIDAASGHPSWAHVALVASERDLRFLSGKPAILMEHGAGQSYGGSPESAAHPGYAGGDGRETVILFLCPNEHSAQRNRARYDVPAVVIGNPRLDALRAIPRTNHPLTVAWAFHWGCGVSPESGSAFAHWRDHLDLPDARLVGTGHPRGYVELAGAYQRAGVIPVEDWRVIVAEADILLADNTSVMYEWAALDRPVIALNCPAYRKHVDHGLRFWDAVPGRQCDDPVDLPGALERVGDKTDRKLRAHAARIAYGEVEDGPRVAAVAICDTLDRVKVPVR